MATEQELEQARRNNAAKLGDVGASAYPNDFRASDEDNRLRAEAVRIANDPVLKAELPQEGSIPEDALHYPLFGRVVAMRGPFVVIQTPDGQAQTYIPKKGADLPENHRGQLAGLDLSDHILVRGPLMGTRKGDAAVRALSYQHLSKALLPPPAKFKGLTDVEKRYRERYVDLFSNPEVRDVFVARSLIVRALRRFLDDRDFLEVETPLLQSLRGGATARPFKTHHNALDIPLYLRVAPELFLKRLLVGGLDRVYELGTNFRNEGVSTRHSPEFAMLEFYLAYATFEDQMDLTEALIRSADQAVRDRFGDKWAAERTVNLDEPFKRVPMVDAIVERVARSGEDGLPPTRFDGLLDAEVLGDAARLEQVCAEAGPRLREGEREELGRCDTHGARIMALFEMVAEADLEVMYRSADGDKSLAVFITRFPFEVSPLARRNDAEPAFADRFEIFAAGRELGNGFSELNDPDDQAVRFQAQVEGAKKGDKEAMDYDEDYIRALKHGMPSAAGCGVGVERLVMLLLNQSSIRDVLLFPLMRPEGT